MARARLHHADGIQDKTGPTLVRMCPISSMVAGTCGPFIGDAASAAIPFGRVLHDPPPLLGAFTTEANHEQQAHI